MLWLDLDVVTSWNKSSRENKTLYWIKKQLSFKKIQTMFSVFVPFTYFILLKHLLGSCFKLENTNLREFSSRFSIAKYIF